MRAMVLKLLGIPLARDADHQPEIPVKPGLDSGDAMTTARAGSTPSRVAAIKNVSRCPEEGIRGGLAGQLLRIDRVAINLHLEEGIQIGGLQDGLAVLT